jgi:sarcosine oxidase, subunit gamma
MPERYQWQSALATLGIEARALASPAQAGVVLSERAPDTQLAIRGNALDERFSQAVAGVLGLELPVTPKTASRKAGKALLWLGPDEWLAVMASDGGALRAPLEEALSGLHHAVVDVSHSRIVIRLAGADARDVLMKGTNIDLHPRQFGPDNCIQARLARAHMLLHQLDDSPCYDLYIHRSFAVYAWSWLCDAAREYGLTVRGTGEG